MKLDRLFNVLVLGGALVAANTACGSAPTLPDKPPTEAPAQEPSSKPASSDSKKNDSEEQEQEPSDEEIIKDGVCSWL